MLINQNQVSIHRWSSSVSSLSAVLCHFVSLSLFRQLHTTNVCLSQHTIITTCFPCLYNRVTLFIIPSISNAHRLFDISHFFLDRSPFKKQESKKNKKNKTHTHTHTKTYQQMHFDVSSSFRTAHTAWFIRFPYCRCFVYRVGDDKSHISRSESNQVSGNPTIQSLASTPFLSFEKKIDPHSFLYHHYQHLPPYPTDLEINKQNKTQNKHSAKLDRDRPVIDPIPAAICSRRTSAPVPFASIF